MPLRTMSKNVLAPDQSGTSAPSARATQLVARRSTRPSRSSSATAPRQPARRPPAPSPASPVDEITVSSTGDMVGVAISMPDPWTVTPAGGGSPYEGPVSVDNHLGRDDMTIYFYWNQDHEFVEPASFEFIVRGSANRTQNITVHTIE